MEKMNLSRLHSSIKTESAFINDLTRRLGKFPVVRSMRIFEKTSQAEMEAFISRCDASRADFLAAVAEIMAHENYLSYLKAELEKANRRAHVGEILLDAAARQRAIQRLRGILDMLTEERRAAGSGVAALADIRAVDDYKSTYTENNRIYDLEVEIFGQPEAARIENEILEEDKEHRRIMDRLAAVNQKTFVNIMDFEEFSASAEKPANPAP